MKGISLLGVLVAVYWIGFVGYRLGKGDADRWYAQHQPVATTPQIITSSITDNGTDVTSRTMALSAIPREFYGGIEGHRFEYFPYKGNRCMLIREDAPKAEEVQCPKVKLIPPIKVRAAAPTAQIQEPK